jgi:hypothetical protein
MSTSGALSFRAPPRSVDVCRARNGFADDDAALLALAKGSADL